MGTTLAIVDDVPGDKVAGSAWRAWLACGLGAAALVAASAGVWLTSMTRTTMPAPGTEVVTPSFFIGWVVFAAVGVLLAVRRSSNAVGWVLLVAGLGWVLSGLAGAYRAAVLLEGFDWPAATVAAWAWDWTWAPGLALVFVLPLVFPDGRLPSPRWLVAVVLLVIGTAFLSVSVAFRPGMLPSTPEVTNPFGVGWLASAAAPLELAGSFLLGAVGLAAFGSVWARYRRAGAVERQQIKWFACAAAVVVVALIGANLLEAAGATPELLGNVRLLPLVLLPIAIGVAVLQHRLYDIDVVINKAFVYGALGAFIGIVYIAVVVGIGSILGRQGDAVVPLSIAATTVTAVAFAPVRDRLQHIANRLVYGQRASPYEVLASFTSRMPDVAPGTDALDEIARTVAAAVGAESAQVWLRVGSELRRATSWPDPMPPASLPVVDGVVPDLPNADRTYPVRRSGRVLGALAISMPRGDRLRPAEDVLLVDLASSAWLLLDNVALIGELRASRQRLVTAQDAERARIERDLHDGAQQRLLELALTLRRARDEVAAPGAGAAADTLDTAQTQLRGALAELREFARGIHPAVLATGGLEPALESLAERATLPVTVDHDALPRMRPEVEATAYFVVSEALANVTKHAGATHAAVAVTLADDRLRLVVRDDGVGGANPAGAGLQGLVDRVTAIGGRVRVDSPPGAGTSVEAELPCG